MTRAIDAEKSIGRAIDLVQRIGRIVRIPVGHPLRSGVIVDAVFACNSSVGEANIRDLIRTDAILFGICADIAHRAGSVRTAVLFAPGILIAAVIQQEALIAHAVKVARGLEGISQRAPAVVAAAAENHRALGLFVFRQQHFMQIRPEIRIMIEEIFIVVRIVSQVRYLSLWPEVNRLGRVGQGLHG